MKPRRRFLTLTALIVFLLACVITLSAARTFRSSAAPRLDCKDECAEKRDKFMERCDELPNERRERCRNIATSQYDKCVERCGEDDR